MVALEQGLDAIEDAGQAVAGADDAMSLDSGGVGGTAVLVLFAVLSTVPAQASANAVIPLACPAGVG